MALVTRTLTNAGAPLYSPDGDLLVGVKINFQLMDTGGRPSDAWDATTNERVGGETIVATTDAAGEFSVDLWPNTRGNRATKYKCRVQSEGFREFSGIVEDVPGELQWVDFMLGGAAMEPQDISAIAVAMTSHINAADPHTQYAHEADLGGAALLDVGTTAGTVAAGDDARLEAVATKVDKVAGKGLSTEDYSTADKTKVAAFKTAAGTPPSISQSYAAISVNGTRQTIDRHAFEDWSQLDTTDTNLGYASFDAKATMNNSLHQNHFVGYQARMTYSGSGDLTAYMHGYDVAMKHTGSGTIESLAGILIRDVTGSGPIKNQYGLYIYAPTRGVTKYSIYTTGGIHYFGGQATVNGEVYTQGIRVTAAAAGFNFGVDVAGKTLVYGYGSAGQTNFGTHDFYNGKNGLVARISNTGLAITGEVTTTKPLRPPVHTLAALPVGTEGATAYCSNGRKVGEGAGAGTGVPVYFSGSAWRRFSDDTVVSV